MKLTHSPLWYPGGKSWLVSTLLELIPAGTHRVVSPFLGGGVFELNACRHNYTVVAGDIDANLINFYKDFSENPKKLHTETLKLWSAFTEKSLYACKKAYKRQGYQNIPPALFWIFNRTAFSGITYGSLSICKFDKPVAFQAEWTDLKGNATFLHADFGGILSDASDAFVYADPPYYQEGDRLYQCDFPHEALARYLDKLPVWALSYDDCEWVRQHYSKYRMLEMQRRYVVSQGASLKKNELLIVSDAIQLPAEQGLLF